MRVALVALLAACSSNQAAPTGSPLPDEVWIPAGAFTMGHAAVAKVEAVDADFVVPHRVELSGFFIDKFAVTNSQYKACFDAGMCPDEAVGWRGYSFRDPRLADYPFATLASHPAAEAYCHWMGKRLPTEAEWERAARGPDSFDYPWGNSPPDCAQVHCDRPQAAPPFNHYYRVADTGADVSPEGVRGMLTGVLETVQDKYDFQYYRRSPTRDPRGPRASPTGQYVARGNWHAETSDLHHMSFAGLENPLPAWVRTHWGGYGTGLRCARSDTPVPVTAEFIRERQRLLQRSEVRQ